MVGGTFCESYFGTEFANRAIYKSPLFMGTQLAIFLCAALAALLRWPPQKRLFGFYTVHTGLIFIGAGSFTTYYAGIDGQIHLPPQTPAREIILERDLFTIHYPKRNQSISIPLPYKAFPQKLHQSHGDITLLRYLPFAKREFHWKPSPSSPGFSGTYLLANANIQRPFTLTLHPEAIDFSNTLTLGLSISTTSLQPSPFAF